MAATLIGRLRDWPHNPLRVTGTPLPPNVLLVAKLIVFCLVAKGYKIPEPFLPLWPIVDAIPRPDLLCTALQGAFWLAALGLLLNVRVRTCALIAGLAFLSGPLIARGAYANGNFFCSSLLILTGLYRPPLGIWLLRAQLVIMYAGSSLNKLLEPDWRDGTYFDHWLSEIRPSPLYLEAAAWLPPMVLATLLGWGTIVTEAALAIGFTVPRLYRPTIWVAILMHGASVIVAWWDFGIFFSVLLFSFLLFTDWPAAVDGRVDPRRPSHRLLRGTSEMIDADRRFRWEPVEGAPLRLEDPHRVRVGVDAVNRWLLLNPASFFAAAALLALTRAPQHGLRVAALVLGVGWFSAAALLTRLRRR